MPTNETEQTADATPGHVASTDQLGFTAPMPRVLDPASGSRMMWLDRGHPDVLFGDKRYETLTVTDSQAHAAGLDSQGEDDVNLSENIADAKRSQAESAIAMPGVYPEYGMWRGRLQELEQAKRSLAVAEARWLRIIEPALGDELLHMLAKRKGLIP